MGKPDRDLRGQKFGRLVAVEYLGGSRWLCRCECGGEARCLTSNLVRENSRSCGCATREAHFKHGMSGTPVYKVWQAMRDRCDNRVNREYRNYGGRGIAVCERWQDFSNFLSDMGSRPKGFDIERKNNDGPYSPENCRWASRQLNLNNRRCNNRVEFRGQTKTVAEWAAETGMHEETLRRRILNGWPAERALTEPVHRSNPSPYRFRSRPRETRASSQ
jgi:hypothetical protein